MTVETTTRSNDAPVTTAGMRAVLWVSGLVALAVLIRFESECSVWDGLGCSRWLAVVDRVVVASFVFWALAGAMTIALLTVDAVLAAARSLGHRLRHTPGR